MQPREGVSERDGQQRLHAEDVGRAVVPHPHGTRPSGEGRQAAAGGPRRAEKHHRGRQKEGRRGGRPGRGAAGKQRGCGEERAGAERMPKPAASKTAVVRRSRAGKVARLARRRLQA
jgi:hypothetical protein